jgi:hypothetical protein
MHALVMIYGELERIANPGERVSEADRLLSIFSHPHSDQIPAGRLYVKEPATGPPVLWPAKKEFLRRVKGEREVFERIEALFPNGQPETLKILKQRFEYGIEMSLKLYEYDKNLVRRDHHQLPPYAYGFESLLKNVQNYYRGIPLEDITFTDKFVGHGTFAAVYLAEAKDGKKYAVKIFNPVWQYLDHRIHNTNFCAIQRAMLDSLKTNEELLKYEAFAQVRGVYRPESREPWYMMDFLDGKSVADMIQDKDDIPAKKRQKILLTYALMLQHLHRQNHLFIDNGWGSVIVNDSSIGICDLDVISREDENTGEKLCTGVAPHKPNYASREQLLRKGKLTKVSDLENFALMIDHLFTRKYFLVCGGWEQDKKEMGKAEDNYRKYPARRAKKVPKEIRTLVHDLISYPRDDSITIDDFVKALT